MKILALVLASGSGTRFESSLPKPYIKIKGKSVMYHSLLVFENNNNVDSVLLMVHPDHYERANNIVLDNNFEKVTLGIGSVQFAHETIFLGSQIICDKFNDHDFIIIHDVVRPLINEEDINQLISVGKKYNVAMFKTNLIYDVNSVSNGFLNELLVRGDYCMSHNPMIIRNDLFSFIHQTFTKEEKDKLDNNLIRYLQYLGHKIRLIEGDRVRLTKITFKEDMDIIEKHL